MTRVRFIRVFTLALMGVSAVFPPQVMAAAPAVGRAVQLNEVALQSGGVLVGQLVDFQNVPIAGQEVTVLFEGQQIASTTTDAYGRFGLRGLRGGLHQVHTANSSQVYQLWAPNTAPPQAQSSVKMIGLRDMQVVRGQDDGGLTGLETLLIVGLITGGIIWGVTSNNDDDGDGS